MTRSPTARASAKVSPTAHTCGIGKRHPGHDPVRGHVLGWLAANRRGSDPRLVLAHVGQGRQPVAVADRVQPAPGHAHGPQLPVHLDSAPRFQAHPIEAEAGRGRPAADGHQDLVAGELAPVSQLRDHRAVAAHPAGGCHLGPGHRGNALRLECGPQLLAGERFLAGEQPLRAFEHVPRPRSPGA